METMFLNEHTQLKKCFKLKKTSVKTLLYDLFKKNLTNFLNFCVGTLFLNEKLELKK